MAGRCPLCGVANSACGAPTGATHPDAMFHGTIPERTPIMSELRPYKVEMNGIVTTLLLSDEDAKARGLDAAVEPEPETKAAEPAASKARRARNKA